MKYNSLKEHLLVSFQQIYQHKPDIIVCTPSQATIMGHANFDDNYSLSMAVDNQLFISASIRQDDQIHLTALNYKNAQVQFSLFDIKPSPIETWCNYLLGVIALFKRNGYVFPGFNAAITGNIPIGIGLSSSTALLTATSLLLQKLGKFTLDKTESAKICQKAENLFCGVQSGLAEYFTATLAESENALLVDPCTVSYQQIPLPDNFVTLICNTMKSNNLKSLLDERQKECTEALMFLEKLHNKRFGFLRNVPLLELSQAEKSLPISLFKRAKHIISENARVMAAVNAISKEDLAGLGILMNESYESLQSLYQVSCPEADLMVKIARQQLGVFGARLTSLGSGSCTINLVAQHQAQKVTQKIKEEYYKQTGITPDIYLATPQRGAFLV